MKALEIVNWANVERMRRASELEVFVQFTSGRDHMYSCDTNQQVEEMMDSFGRWCVFGFPEASSSYVIYEDQQ